MLGNFLATFGYLEWSDYSKPQLAHKVRKPITNHCYMESCHSCGPNMKYQPKLLPPI